MRPKSMILILIALGCGLVASVGISKVMEDGKSNRTSTETVQIYVAMADIPLGETLTPQMLKLEEWPKDKIPEGGNFHCRERRGPETAAAPVCWGADPRE